MFINLQGIGRTITKEQAEAIAQATGTRLDLYNPGEDRPFEAVFDNPPAVIGPPRDMPPESNSIEITFQMYDADQSLEGELRRSAKLLHHLLLTKGPTHQDRNAGNPIIIRTRMSMNTDRLPEGQPDDRTQAPIVKTFFTTAGHRCLGSVSWYREALHKK